MPNLPPGVASMLHPQYVAAAGLAPAAFYGLQQPMYGAYGNAGLDDLAALAHQRASASAAGLHTLVGQAAAGQQPVSTALQSAMQKVVCKQRSCLGSKDIFLFLQMPNTSK